MTEESASVPPQTASPVAPRGMSPRQIAEELLKSNFKIPEKKLASAYLQAMEFLNAVHRLYFTREKIPHINMRLIGMLLSEHRWSEEQCSPAQKPSNTP